MFWARKNQLSCWTTSLFPARSGLRTGHNTPLCTYLRLRACLFRTVR